MKKTVYYIVAIVVLLIANGYLLLSNGASGTPSVDKSYFASEDLGSLSKLRFTSEEDSVVIERSGQDWTTNGGHKVDEGFFNTLISILDRIEKVRSIPDWDGQILGNVRVEFGSSRTEQFQIASNATRTKSYFISEDGTYEVTVPGYRDNVVDIFLLHPDQWRDRLVFDGSWRTIQKAVMEYSESDNGFEIAFDDKFFLINNATPSDSSAVIEYLNQFQYFQANEMISKGRFTLFDSLSSTSALATLTIDDIKYDEPIVLTIFPNLSGQAYHLVMDGDDQMMVIDARRIRDILKSARDFGIQ